METKISLIHPSRGRPQKAFEAFSKWLDKSEDTFEYILSLDSDEPTNTPNGSSQYLTLFNSRYSNHRVIVNNNRSAVDAINNAAKAATGEIIIQMADDFECPVHWDEQIRQAVEGKTDWIMKTPNGIQSWTITLPIMDRAYYNRFGYIYYPEYLHMFCDTELSCVADLTGRRIECNIPFRHNHYSVTKTTPDEVSRKADSTWIQGEKLFLERYRRNFDLVNPPGRITSKEYLNWIKGKL